MATIQIRDIPESAYETLRRRARRDSRSIQAYMRERVIEMAEAPSGAETVQLIEKALAESGRVDSTVQHIVEDVAAERR